MSADQILIAVIGLFLLSTGVMYFFHLKNKGQRSTRESSVIIGLFVAGLILILVPFFGLFSFESDNKEIKKSILQGPEAYGPGLPKATLNYEEAIKYYNRTIALYRIEIPGFVLLDSASFYINESLKNYETAEALIVRGQIRVQKGNMDGAMADYNRAIDLNPELGNAYFNRAAVYYIKYDMQKACEDWKIAKKYEVPGAEAALSMYCN